MGIKRKSKKPAQGILDIQKQIHSEIEKATADNKKKLRRKKQGITGVAAGLADYFGIDPTWMRIGLVGGTILTSGALIIPYAIMAFVLPKESAPVPYDHFQLEHGEDWPLYSEDLPEATETQTICWNCDTAIRPNAKYCPHCGAKL